MDRLIAMFAPRHWYDWVFSLLFWMLAVVFLGAGIKIALRGELGEPWLHHIILAAGISAPFGIFAQVLIRHLQIAREDLARLAATDVLTGLANRRGFFTRIEQPAQGVVMLLDVDHFKRVNDEFGHDIGDMVLQAVADLLTAHTRSGDLVGRIGGEEFAVFLPDAPPHTAREIGDRLCRGVTLDVGRPGETPLKVTLSAGAASVSGTSPPVAVLKAADHALYKAKRAGRAQLVFRGDSLMAG